MKIGEIREILKGYSDEQLRAIITEMYKAIPKAIKENKDIDSMIKDTTTLAQSGKRREKEVEPPDIEFLRYEVEEFIEYAYKQYYFAPNSFVHKKDRPKWRFTVKRFFKELTSAASVEENLPIASELLEKLYVLLCYACSYILFSGDDPFWSVGIEQKDFFHRVISLKYQYENKSDFIENAIALMVNNSLNRDTLYFTLMNVILEFLKTPDMNAMAVAKCDKLILTAKSEHPTQKTSEYEIESKIKNLSEMGFLCYAHLYEYDNAIDYFKKNYSERDKEISLYALLRLLFQLGLKDYWLKEYEEAIKNGIQPRERLIKMYRFIQENKKLPDYIL